MKDQSFWREVAARALSGLIVVFVGYVILAANGLLGLPNPVKLLSAFLIIGVGALVMWPLVKLSQWVIRTISRKVQTKWLRITLTCLWSGVFILSIGYIMLVAHSVAVWFLNNAPG